ncbi:MULTISPECIES: plasmid mobilization relaxosome protein MobC [Pseudomonas]|uniref:plasmid mobilization relaxosome protein MobC n=1 Tax=Pseudomonas TaxID=286 RepID=UPI00345F90D4
MGFVGQLRAIGRNLNQIAKKLNDGSGQGLSTRGIKQLSDYIHSHTEVVSELQDASLSRWKIT